MHRLLVESSLLDAQAVVPPKDAARHLKVLRPKPNEEIELFDGHGRTRVFHWRAADGTLADPGETTAHPAPAQPLTLFACVTKGSRWDWTIEKAVELGTSRIVPVMSARCIVRLAPGERETKAERWRRVAEDAARQSDAGACEAARPAAARRHRCIMRGGWRNRFWRTRTLRRP